MDDPIIQHIMTLCMFQKGDEFLRLDRQHDDFTGFIPGEYCGRRNQGSKRRNRVRSRSSKSSAICL